MANAIISILPQLGVVLLFVGGLKPPGWAMQGMANPVAYLTPTRALV